MSLALGAQTSRRLSDFSWLMGYAAALALVAAATAIALGFEQQVRIPNLSLIFVLPVVVAAVGFGWGPSLFAAVAGVVAYNFFLIPPLHTFVVADPANVLALVLLLAVGAIASGVAAESRRRAQFAIQAAGQAMALQTLARILVGATDRPALTQACAEGLAELFDAPAVVLTEVGDALELASAGGARLSEPDLEAARWSLAARLPTRGEAYPTGEARYDFWPVVTPLRQGAALGVAISDREQGRPAQAQQLVEIVAAYLAVALDRELYAQEVLDARVEMARERLKADLLAAVSHDLRTPLSTIIFTLQSLRKFRGVHDEGARTELLELAETEATRLSGLVENLLDMSRLEEGAVTPHLSSAAPADLVAAGLVQASSALTGRCVVNEVDADAQPLIVDAGLFESALAKVLENAGKYAPEGSTIHVRAGWDGSTGWIEVEDEGPGFPSAPEPFFDKFRRGVSGDGRPPGLGLGLSIARGFLAAMGGRIEAANRDNGAGARVRLSVPLEPGTKTA